MTGILCSLAVIGAPTATPPAAALAVALNRSSVSGSATSASITTNSVKATASSGDSPYTYAWSRVSGDSSISATSAASASTSFTRTGCTAGTAYSATWRCKATDDAGNIAYSADVSITITCTVASGGGGGTGGGTFNGIDDTNVHVGGSTSPKTATFSINSDGTYTTGTWNSSSSVGSSYEVKATMISGSTTTGTIGSWLPLSSNRSWTITDTDDDNVESACSFTLQIRQAGTTTAIDSATISLSAYAFTL